MYLSPDDNGFSLLEVLVAIFVSTLIITGSHQLLEQVIHSGKISARYNEQTTELLHTSMLLTRDLLEAKVDQQHRFSVEGIGDNCVRRMVFFTTNRPNAGALFGDPLTRVIWEVREGKLLRYYYDRGSDSGPTGLVTGGILCMQMRRYTRSQQWETMMGITDHLPSGMAFKLTFSGRIVIEKIVPGKIAS